MAGKKTDKSEITGNKPSKSDRAGRITEKSEIARLREIYANLPPKKKALAEGLIIQAARLRVILDDLSDDIAENGMTEMFNQSAKTDAYERIRPKADLFIKTDKSYQAIIRQLTDMLPPETEQDDDLSSFRGM